MTERNIPPVSTFTDSTWTANRPWWHGVDRDAIAVVLDYAYYGLDRDGITCGVASSREEGCALCDSLSYVEKLAGLEAPKQNWWRAGLTRRVLDWIGRRLP